MDFEEKIGVFLITGFLALSLVSLSKAQWESGIKTINASIYQPISVELSSDLIEGIFFTNGSQIGIQYPITDVTIENNATANYAGPDYSTKYHLNSSSGNKINISAYMTLCDNLYSDDVKAWINLTYNTGDGGQGMFFGNGTSPTEPTLTVSAAWSFSAIDTYHLIAPVISPGSTRYFRFWLDPWPNNAPSGIYNTTFKIRAVEYNQDPGSGSC
ncbi:MAG: hypothetical protein QW228_09855 [Candidatus Aenigmatarchaeota archaeon]